MNNYIWPYIRRPYRLVAQDSGFSFPQQRFETAWGYEKELTVVSSFLYTRLAFFFLPITPERFVFPKLIYYIGPCWQIAGQAHKRAVFYIVLFYMT